MAAYECKVTESRDYGDHTLFVCRNNRGCSLRSSSFR
ncbi:MAG: flavin reductase [Thermotogae bacterium]|nr:flavin reductase [Thermotogota bacterium]